jgi:hypothetical protein
MSDLSDFLTNSEETAKKIQESPRNHSEGYGGSRGRGELGPALRLSEHRFATWPTGSWPARASSRCCATLIRYSINTVGASHVDFSVSSADVQGDTATVVVNRTFNSKGRSPRGTSELSSWCGGTALGGQCCATRHSSISHNLRNNRQRQQPRGSPGCASNLAVFEGGGLSPPSIRVRASRGPGLPGLRGSASAPDRCRQWLRTR